MQFTVFEKTTGRIGLKMEVPSADDAIANLQPGQLLVEGLYDGAAWYIAAGGTPTPRPEIPQPAQDGNFLRWPDPPPGLRSKVHDLWIDPPHLLVDTPLTAPDCGLHLPEAGAGYRIDLSADFPWLPITLEVAP